MTDCTLKGQAKQEKESLLYLFMPNFPYIFDIPRKKPQNNFPLTFVLYDIFYTTAEYIMDLFFQIINKDIE